MSGELLEAVEEWLFVGEHFGEFEFDDVLFGSEGELAFGQMLMEGHLKDAKTEPDRVGFSGRKERGGKGRSE